MNYIAEFDENIVYAPVMEIYSKLQTMLKENSGLYNSLCKNTLGNKHKRHSLVASIRHFAAEHEKRKQTPQADPHKYKHQKLLRAIHVSSMTQALQKKSQLDNHLDPTTNLGDQVDVQSELEKLFMFDDSKIEKMIKAVNTAIDGTIEKIKQYTKGGSTFSAIEEFSLEMELAKLLKRVYGHKEKHIQATFSANVGRIDIAARQLNVQSNVRSSDYMCDLK